MRPVVVIVGMQVVMLQRRMLGKVEKWLNL